MPRLVGVAECDHVARLRADGRRHRFEHGVGAILEHVERVAVVVAVEEADRGPRRMPAKRPDVDSEGECTEHPLRGGRRVRQRPLEAHVRELFLTRALRPAAAVLVMRRHRRVVVARHAGDARRDDAFDDLVRLARIPDEVTQVIRRRDVRTRGNIGERRVEVAGRGS